VILLGTQLSVLLGPTAPVPAPPHVVEAIDRISVNASDEGRTGFQITFRVGRGQTDVLDYALLVGPLLQPFSRVVLTVIFSGIPSVLLDGIITNQQLSPGAEPGTSTLTITGEDVSVMMDLEEKSVEHPAQPEAIIAAKIIATYAQYGLIPMVIPPPSVDMPLPTERIPVQQETDLDYLKEMAGRFGYTFYVEAGPAPLTNTAYWGPPIRTGIPQKALTVNMGPDTNVMGDLNFSYDGLAPTAMSGQIRDRQLNQTLPVQTFVSTRIPLSPMPALLTQMHKRTRAFRETGLTLSQAFARAQAQTDASTDRTVTATGTLDAMRYQAVLRSRGLVGVRGVGFSYDGFYYVNRVDHTIEVGKYTQSFELSREGLGALSPVVPT
jgi:hypothetical protein